MEKLLEGKCVYWSIYTGFADQEVVVYDGNMVFCQLNIYVVLALIDRING
jgi:hypothetical protein